MRKAAAKLAALIPRERFDPAVLAWLAAAPRRGCWNVGFSGGADSLALLLLLWGHWPERRRRLCALHFDHRLRGAESRGDARFCRRVCRALGVKLTSGVWSGTRSGASEAAAREARLGFFAQHARVVWLGHQQDDIAESLLMRLARGSGTGGLAAPRPVQRLANGRVHLRPLLAVKKAEILAALRQAGTTWREDSSNAGDVYFRNRVRREVMPRWIKAAQRDALAGAARSRLLLEEDDAALETWLDELRPVDAGGKLRLARLRGKPRALWRRALHRWLGRHRPGPGVSRQAFEMILDSLQALKTTRHSLGREGCAVTDGRSLRFEAARGKPERIRRGAN